MPTLNDHWMALLVLPLFVSVNANFKNLKTLRKVSAKSEAMTAAATASGSRDLVTNFGWAPQILMPLWRDHRIFLNPNRKLLESLRTDGAQSVTQILGGLEKISGNWSERKVVVNAAIGAITYEFRPRDTASP